jgi:hypothetical protein
MWKNDMPYIATMFFLYIVSIFIISRHSCCLWLLAEKMQAKKKASGKIAPGGLLLTSVCPWSGANLMSHLRILRSHALHLVTLAQLGRHGVANHSMTVAHYE